MSGRKFSALEISIREVARLAGEKYYFFTCPRGHENSRRRVSDTACSQCHREGSQARSKERYRNEPARAIWICSKARAKGHPLIGFSITVEDVQAVWPADNRCPIFGWILHQSGGRGPCPQSPTLDRIDPQKGYVVGNIAVISHKANLIKQDITDPAVFERMAAWLRFLR